MSTVSPAQALADLGTLITNLTAAVTGVSNELTALLTAIKNNNGVNPGAIETLITTGEGLVSNLNAAVAAAQAAVNPPIAVSISPTSATVAPGGTQTFSASVTNDSANAGVTWSVATGGQGSVSAGVYTAPAGAIPGTDTVVATSVTDPTKSASASVTIS